MAATRRRRRTRRRGHRRLPKQAWIGAVIVVALLGVLALQDPATAPVRAAPETPRLVHGADASWPQCRHPKRLPLAERPAFAIVGVNNGVPGTLNPCLGAQLAWAATATGGAREPTVAYYVMAADPWSPFERKWAKPVWPSSNSWKGQRVAVPKAYGSACRGGHTQRSCAYVFGWSVAERDAHLTGVRSAGDRTWWIDVEEERDWSADQRFNEAIIEGMAAYFETPARQGGLGARAGLYSNDYYWATIVGVLRSGSRLAALPNWVPIGPATREEATAAFPHADTFTPGGHVALLQYVSGGIDRNLAPAP
jgi:hypothetical protein